MGAQDTNQVVCARHAGDSLQIHTNERDEDAVWIDVSILLEQSIERLEVVKVLRDVEFVFIFTVQIKISAWWQSMAGLTLAALDGRGRGSHQG